VLDVLAGSYPNPMFMADISKQAVVPYGWLAFHLEKLVDDGVLYVRKVEESPSRRRRGWGRHQTPLVPARSAYGVIRPPT
jgi:hypothetical protein